MVQKILSACWLYLFICFPNSEAVSCGFLPSVYRGYTLIYPEITGDKPGKPFLFSEVYYPYYYHFEHSGKAEEAQRNIAEWQAYFCAKPLSKDIAEIIYNAPIADIKLLQKKEHDRNYTLPDKLENNTLAIHLSEYDHEGFLEYMLFAKACEPANHSRRNRRWESEKSTSDNMSYLVNRLISEGQEKYTLAKDDFIKLRYGFLIVRLASYHGYDAVALYDQLVEPLKNVSSIIHFWAMAQKAGALMRTQQFENQAMANYLFCKSLMQNNFTSGSEYRSLKINTTEMWNAVYQLCQTNEERASLHYIRSLDTYSKALEEMVAIYQLYPQAPYLELLLVRELQKLEIFILEDKFDGFEAVLNEVKTIPKEQVKAYLQKLKPFIKKIEAERKVLRPAFWSMARGYIEFLDGNHRYAQQILKKAITQSSTKNILNDQIEVIQYALLMSLMNTVEPWMEEKLGKLFSENIAFQNFLDVPSESESDDENQDTNKSPYFAYHEYNYIFGKMADLYYKKGELGKAYLCLYSIYGLKYYPDSKIVQSVLDFFDKPNKNAFENYLLKKEKIKDREEIIEILGTALLIEDRVWEANIVFSQHKNLKKSIESPFESKRFWEDTLAINKNFFSKKEMTEKVIKLKYTANSFMPKRADAHLQLGNYYFNTSWYGHAWKARDYFRSIYQDEDLSHPLSRQAYNDRYNGIRGNRDVKSLSKAIRHFEIAVEIGAKETQAEAAFMLAKCEREKHYQSTGLYHHYNKTTHSKEEIYQKKYRQLAKKYAETDYFKKAIRECKDYDSYVNK